MAKQTVVKFMSKTSRLYEQEHCGAVTPDALGMHVRRWVRSAEAGLVTENAGRNL